MHATLEHELESPVDHKIHLCAIDNHNIYDYVTLKMWQSLHAICHIINQPSPPDLAPNGFKTLAPLSHW